MRNLRLLRAGGCRSAAATGTPQCFCLGAEPGAVLVGSQYGLVELHPAGDSVRAVAAGPGSAGCRRVGVGFGCKTGMKYLRQWDLPLGGRVCGLLDPPAAPLHSLLLAHGALGTAAL